MPNFSIRERAGLAAVAVTIVVLTLGGLAYRQTHAPAALLAPGGTALSPGAPRGITLGSVAGEENNTVEVTAKGDQDATKSAQHVSPPTGEPKTSVPASAATTATTTANDALIVYISGAVKKPGVYTFKKNDRIYHAVRAAGGFKPNAQQDALNLADALRDADQLIVPVRGKSSAPVVAAAATPPVIVGTTAGAAALKSSAVAASPPALKASKLSRGRVLGQRVATPPVDAAAASSATAAAPSLAAPAPSGKFKPGDGTINLNTAGEVDLQRLPGVGPAMAQRILAFRKEIGGFKSCEQLLDVKGIGDKKFAKMQPFVAVP